MLKHHADAKALGMAGILHDDLLAFPQHLAGVGLHHAIDHFHQCALAGTVFTEQRVDLVALDGEGDVVVGEAARVLPGHAG